MKRLFSGFLGLFLLVALGGCSGAREPQAPVDVGPEVAAPLALADTLLTLTISDVHGLLDGVGEVAAQFSPMLNGSMIKTFLGSKLGDPLLTGFAPGTGLSAVMLEEGDIFVVAEVSSPQADSYVQGLQSMGLRSRIVGGLLLVAQTEDQLQDAERLAQTVQSSLLAAKRSPSLRLAVQPAGLIAKNEAVIAEGLQKMLVQMQQASSANQVMDVQKILEAELHVFLSIGRQIDVAEVELLPKNGAVEITEVIAPVAGSRLATFCNAPALRPFNSKIQPGYLSEGAIVLEYCNRNADSCTAFLNGECQALQEAMEFDGAWVQSYLDYMNRWMAVLGGTVCESVFTGSDGTLGLELLLDITDEEAMLSLLRSMSDELEQFGLFSLYESMGMPLSVEFVENVRQYAGLKIHQLKVDFSFEEMSAEQVALFESMMGELTYEVAIYKNQAVYTMGDGKMELVIDRLKEKAFVPKSLAARDLFPSGGLYYADFDLGRYLTFIAKWVSNVQQTPDTIGKIAESLSGADPISMVAFCNSGRLKSSMQIPGSLLVRCAQAGQLIAAESAQKKMAQKASAKKKSKRPNEWIGRLVPDVAFTMLDGSNVQLASHVGKQVVVLDFWASWCGPCRKGLPVVQKTAELFADDDVVFYAINAGEDARAVTDFCTTSGLTLPVVLGDFELGKAFGVSGIPHTVVVDKHGVIQAVHSGFSLQLQQQLSSDITAALAK